MFELSRPWALLLFLPFLALTIREIRRAGPTLIQVLPGSWTRRAGPRVRPPLPWFLRMLGVALFLLALSGPRARLPGFPGEGVTLVLVLDISGSMETRDMEGQTRLEAAKGELARFVRARPQDLLGLVTFSREAATRVPPTMDHQHLLRALEVLEVDGESDGTAVGVGLGLATHRAVQGPGPSRAVVLMTDGRSNSGSADPLSVARAAGALGVRLHAIGVGGGRGDEPLDEELLQEVARRTEGSYTRATDPGVFREVLAEVDAMETGPVSPGIPPPSRPLHGTLLWLGFLLITLEGLFWMAPGGRAA